MTTETALVIEETVDPGVVVQTDEGPVWVPEGGVPDGGAGGGGGSTGDTGGAGVNESGTVTGY